MFINTTEELAESEVDAVVDMDLEEDLEAAVRRAVEGCVSVLGLDKPKEQSIKEALDAVRGYVPTAKKRDGLAKNKNKNEVSGGQNGSPRYYGLLAEVNLVKVLGQKLELLNPDVSQAAVPAVQLWGKLKDTGRVSKRPHVTIVHKNSLPREEELWNRCAALHVSDKPLLFKAKLGHLLWNERVMTATVEGLEAVGEEGGDGGQKAMLGKAFLDTLQGEVRDRLHITVGTQSQSVPAVEAKVLVEVFRRGDFVPGDGRGVLNLDGLVIHGRIKGLMG